MEKLTAKQLIDTVIRNDYCSGCGVCSATGNSPFSMRLDENGRYFPVLKPKAPVDASIVCPFASHQVNENDLARKYFKNLHHDDHLGYVRKTYVGHVIERDYRQKGSSGGLVTWLTDELLKDNRVDFVLHVKETGRIHPRFQYDTSASHEEARKGRKSKYYPVSMDEVLRFVRNNEGRYAIVGIPCFMKGIRLLQEAEGVFAKRIKFLISIFCGHLKTTHYSKALISQFGVKDDEVKHVDFRHKMPGRKVTDYGTRIVLNNGKEMVKPNKELFGTDWGWGLFKLKACDFCDDVVGEVADISVGDAWLPEFEHDWQGTNAVITRNFDLDRLVTRAAGQGRLHLQEVEPGRITESQFSGFRHKREGLAYRLYSEQKKGHWIPKKRVQPELISNKKRRKIYEIRVRLRQRSFYSKNYENPPRLKNEILPLVKKLNKLYRHSLWTRIRLKIKSFFK